jgi:hypothetical protein
LEIFHSHPSKISSRHSLLLPFLFLSRTAFFLLCSWRSSREPCSPPWRAVSWRPCSFFLGALKLPHGSELAVAHGRTPAQQALACPLLLPPASSKSREQFSLGPTPCSGMQPDAPAMAPFFPAQRLCSPSPKLQLSQTTAAPLPCCTASNSSSPSSSHGAQKFQQQGLHSSSSSTLLSSLAQTSPMARCSRRPRASPPWLATRLPPYLRAAAQCPVGACYVLDEMRSKLHAVNFLQQPRRLLAARCFVLSSGQHAVDARRWLAVFAQPHPRRRRNPW